MIIFVRYQRYSVCNTLPFIFIYHINSILMRKSLLLLALMLVGFVPRVFADPVPLPYDNPCNNSSTMGGCVEEIISNSKRGWNYSDLHFMPWYKTAAYTTAGNFYFPEMDLKAGKGYKITVISRFLRGPGKMRIYAATGTTKETIETTVAEYDVTRDYTSYTGYYTPATDGVRRIAIGCQAPGTSEDFYIDNFRVEECPIDLPAAPTACSASQTEGKNISGSFTAPTVDVFGKGLAADALKYLYVRVGGTPVYTVANPTPGLVYTYTATVPAAGEQSVEFVCVGRSGEGQTSTVTVNIDLGFTLPAWDVDTWNFQWGDHQKYVAQYDATTDVVSLVLNKFEDRDNVIEEGSTYTVVRKPDNVTIATESATANVQDLGFPSDKKQPYWYELTVNQPTKAPLTITGSVVSLNNPLVYSANFYGAAGKELSKEFVSYNIFTEDKNNSRDNWTHAGDYFSVECNNDWLMSPGILLEAGKNYCFKYTISGDYGPAAIEVNYGRANTPEAMTGSVAPWIEYSADKTKATYTHYFTVAESGNHFIGFHAWYPEDKGDPSGKEIRVYSFSISEASEDIPAPVSDVKVDYTSATTAVLSFKAPALNVAGKELTTLERINIMRDGMPYKTIEPAAIGEAYTLDLTIESGMGHKYSIIAENALGTSVAVDKDVILITPPHTDPLTGKNALDYYTIFDMGKDGFTWNIQGNQVRVYPSDRKFDDWLISPSVYMQGGYYYKVQYTTWREKTPYTDTYIDNYITLYVGTGATPDDMKQVAIPEYQVRSNDGVLLKQYITVAESGGHNFGWHATSKANDPKEFYIGDFSISAPMSPYVPGPGVLTVTPDRTGELQADLKVTLPVKDIAGDDLEYPVTQVKLYCDGELAFDIDATTANFNGVWQLREIPEGAHLFTMVCYNEMGIGQEYETINFVGINRPAVPENLTVSRTDNDGEVLITWEAPATDINGFWTNPDLITYDIFTYEPNYELQKYEEKSVATDLPAGTYSYKYQRLSATAPQEFGRYGIRAKTRAGGSQGLLQDEFIAIGRPYDLPYVESFKNGNPKTIFRSEVISGAAYWGYGSLLDKHQPLDDDGGFALMEVMSRGHGAALVSGRVKLSGEHPVLSAYVFNFSDGNLKDNNILGMEVRPDKTLEWEIVEGTDKTVDEWTNGQPGWQKINVDLSKYAGETVQLAFAGFGVSSQFVMLDLITLNGAAVDMAALSTGIPEEAFVGKEFPIVPVIKNLDINPVSGYKVELIRNEEVISTATPEGSLAAGATTTVAFKDLIPMQDRQTAPDTEYTYKVRVTADGDMDKINDTSKALTLNLAPIETYPTVQNLAGVEESARIHLSWEAPAIPEAAAETTDDLESYAAWSTFKTGMGGYTLYDEDDIATAGVSFGWPIEKYSKQSFFLADFSEDWTNKYEEKYPTLFKARSGNKALVSLTGQYYEGQYVVNDVEDWLVSPLLSGEEQTLSFYVKSYYYQGGGSREYFTVVTSSTGKQASCFDNLVADNWSYANCDEYGKVEVTLPAGSKYFAIVHTYGQVLFIDDITFTPAGNERLQVEGYNVYRDGELISERYSDAAGVAAAEAQSTDAIHFYEASPSIATTRTYDITAVYNRGESLPENILVATSAIDGIYGDANAPRAIGGRGFIRILNAEGLAVTIHNVDGMQIDAFGGEADMTADAQPGFYIVSVGTSTFKVAVR